MLTTAQSRVIGKGYAAILERERERNRYPEYAETTTLTIQLQVVGNPAQYENLIRQALRNYRGIASIQTIQPDYIEPAPAREKRYMTVDEAARATGYSEHQITRWLRAGHWIGCKINGHWQIDLDGPLSRPPRKRRH